MIRSRERASERVRSSRFAKHDVWPASCVRRIAAITWTYRNRRPLGGGLTCVRSRARIPFRRGLFETKISHKATVCRGILERYSLFLSLPRNLRSAAINPRETKAQIDSSVPQTRRSSCAFYSLSALLYLSKRPDFIAPRRKLRRTCPPCERPVRADREEMITDYCRVVSVLRIGF